MAQVGFAATALHLCSTHSMAIIWGINNALFFNGLKKTGPSTATVKFGVAFKKGISAGFTMVGAHLF
jgi:hypothetical protein